MKKYENARHGFTWCSHLGTIASDLAFCVSKLTSDKVVKPPRLHFTFSEARFLFTANINISVLLLFLGISFTYSLIKTVTTYVLNEKRIAIRNQISCTHAYVNVVCAISVLALYNCSFITDKSMSKSVRCV